MGFESLPKTTADLAQEQMAKLRALFPECVTEGPAGLAVDFDLLRRALSPEKVVEGPNERYRLEWPGKRAARYAANAPTASTLRPVRERSKDFDATQNLYIEGDNLEALKLLRTAYAGKVKMIYIDPPYNTGHDFIYHDKYVRTVREEMVKAGLLDDEGRQTEDKHKKPPHARILPRSVIVSHKRAHPLYYTVGRHVEEGLQLVIEPEHQDICLRKGREYGVQRAGEQAWKRQVQHGRHPYGVEPEHHALFQAEIAPVHPHPYGPAAVDGHIYDEAERLANAGRNSRALYAHRRYGAEAEDKQRVEDNIGKAARRQAYHGRLHPSHGLEHLLKAYAERDHGAEGEDVPGIAYAVVQYNRVVRVEAKEAGHYQYADKSDRKPLYKR